MAPGSAGAENPFQAFQEIVPPCCNYFAPPRYDWVASKLIARGDTRKKAHARMPGRVRRRGIGSIGT